MARAAWTQDEMDFLAKSYSSFGAKKCAAVLKTKSESAVRQMAMRLGVKLGQKNSTHRKLGVEQKVAIAALYASDPTLSAQDIIDRLGLTVDVDCIYSTLDDANVERGTTGERNRALSDTEELAIVADYESWLCQREIVANQGGSMGRVNGVLKRRGVTLRHQKRELSDVEWVEIARRYQTGEAAADIAPDYGVFHKRILVGLRARGVRPRPPKRYPWVDQLGRSFRFRSQWELHVAQKLDERGCAWNYETRTYDVIVDGVPCRYTPDFVLMSGDGSETLIEVKGRWFTRSQLKVESFRLLHPHMHLEVWDASVLASLGILCSITEHNERRRKDERDAKKLPNKLTAQES